MNYLNYLQKQRSNNDNAASCLSTIFQYYACDNSVDELVRLTAPTEEGTTMERLMQATEGYDFEAMAVKIDPSLLKEYNKPSILHVTSSSSLQQFYIVFFEYEDDMFVMGDTASGTVVNLTEAQLDEIWLSKVCLLLEPK